MELLTSLGFVVGAVVIGLLAGMYLRRVAPGSVTRGAYTALQANGANASGPAKRASVSKD